MIDINTLYERFMSMNHTHQHGWYRPVRDFVPAVHTIQLEVFNELCKHLEKSDRVTSMLLPFYRSANVPIQSTAVRDYAPWPPEYSYYSSADILLAKGEVCADAACPFIQGGKQLPAADLKDFFPVTTEYESYGVASVSDSKFSAASRHKTKGPKLTAPIGRKVSDGVELLPRGVGVIRMHYYANPLPPVYSYTQRDQGVDSYLEYDVNKSTPLQWDEKMLPVLLWKLTVYYGLAVSDQLKLQVQQIAREVFQV